MGVQDQFAKKPPPKTYRYNSSLDPALSWDENHDRGLVKWLISLVRRCATESEAAVFTVPQVWAGGGIPVQSLKAAADLLKTALDTHDALCVKNDHLGFLVPYRKDSVRRRYLPNFIVELTSGERLIVEIKGQTGDAELKASAAYRWCNAVNNDSRFGRWSYHLVKQPLDLMKLLDTITTNI